MARRTLTLKRHADGTLTVRVGRQLEQIPSGLPRAEVFERVRWFAIMCRVNLDAPSTVELLNEATKT